MRKRRERPVEDQSLPDGRLPQPMDIDDGEGLAGGNVHLNAKYELFRRQGDVPNAAPLELDPEPVIPRSPSIKIESYLSINSLFRGVMAKEYVDMNSRLH